MITISMCMIVKNEENILERCLSSYQGIYDELIIVDTGSTDRTKEIAIKYTDKVYDYEWTNDFAAARNYAFSLATCEYIFSADADEELDTANRSAFLDIKQVLLPEIDIVQMYYVNVNETDQSSVYNCKKEYRPKLFKRLRTFEWISPIHETVRLDPIVYDSDIEILHKPQTSHTNRDLSLFLSLLEKNVHLENYCLVMLCKELFISGTDQDFLNFADAFEQKLQYEYKDAFCIENITCVLAHIYRIRNDYNRFFAICLNAYASDPCAELCMELGTHYSDAKMYDEAIQWFENALSQPCFIDVRSSGVLPLTQLSKCYGILAEQAKVQQDMELYEQFYGMQYKYDSQAKAWTLPDEN